MARLISVNVGRPKDISWNGRSVRTAIWKMPVAGRVKVATLGLEGDGQADRLGHGGEQRAVLVYQLSSYRHWQGQLQRAPFDMGQFGENLTVDGLEDDRVCIGDRYRIGSALFEVTQPRVTCFKVGIRLDEPRMPALLVAQGRPGFYMRVVEQGEIGSGDEIEKVADGPEEMSVATVDALLYGPVHPRAELERALRIDALSPGWKGSFKSLLASPGDQQRGNAGLSAPPEKPPAWAGFRPLRVIASCQESEDVRSFLMASPEGAPLAGALPGQHVAVKVPVTSAGTMTRMYSLSGPADDPTYRITVKRGAPGTVSDALHARVRVGDMLEVSAPRGVFTLASGEAPVVLMSAGVGVTPLLSMLHELAKPPRHRTRTIWWVHAARDRRHHSLRDEAARALADCGSARRLIYYSRPTATEILGEDYDVAGHIDLAGLCAAGLPLDADFYLCGPPPMLGALTRELEQLGIERPRIHVEFFGVESRPAKAPQNPLSPRTPRIEETSGARVTFVRSGITTHWGNGTAYRSLLELAEACEVPAQWSCRSGVCHSCQTPVVEGNVSYEPAPLSAPAHGTVLLCCARPVGDVTIDL